MPQRAAIYARQSVTRDRSESLDLQVKGCRRAAKRLGLDVVAELVEPPSTSGYKDRGRERPQFRTLLDLARSGQIDCVISFKTDRLSRGGGPGWAPLLEAFEAAGQHPDKIVATADGNYVSEFEIGIRASMDREESKKLSERMLGVKAHAAGQGRPNGGGRRPFGYADNKFSAIVKPEANLLREAHRRVVSGEGLNTVARDFCRRGITTASGAQWTGQKLDRTLRSPHLAGLRSHTVGGGRRQTHEGNWTPIFTREEHEAVLLAAGEHRPAAVGRHLLTGFLQCGACGGPMRSKHSAKSGPRYECSRCNKVTISAPFVEQLIGGAVLQRLDSPTVRDALADAGTNDSAGKLTRELAERQSALEQLARDHYVDSLISRDAFLAANRRLEEEVERLQSQLARRRASVTVAPGGGDIRTLWASGTLEQRRAVIGAMVTRITVAAVGKGGGGPGKAQMGRVKTGWTDAARR